MKKTLLSVALGLICTQVSAHDKVSSSADAHAPIGVMGDHLHKAGEWMMSYRYMSMAMSDLAQGDNDISTAEALKNYMMVPEEMDMQMHMVGAMYAPNDDVTLMVMTNYLSSDMNSVMKMMHMDTDMDMHSDMDMSGDGMGMGMDDMNMNDAMNMATMQTTDFSVESSGLGDSRLAALIRGYESDSIKTHYTIGVNLPTGDIDKRDATPMNNNALLGYPMQLGTGTYNVFAAYTGVHSMDNIKLGGQINFETAIDENEQDYKPGNKWLSHIWASYSIDQSVSVSARLSYLNKQNYSGMDTRLMPTMMPTADAHMRGVKQVDFALGANYLFTSGSLANHRVAVEWQKPITQDFDGIQMKTDWSLIAGWQYAF